LGRIVAEQFASGGHPTSVIGRRRIDVAMPKGIVGWQTDLGNTADLERTLSEIVASRGALGNLVFCQRYRLSGDDWQGEITTSLTAVKTTIDALQSGFRAEGGSIVIVGSVAGRMIATEQPLSYHVVKGGLLQLVRYYAVQLGGRSIRVNCVSPGTVVKSESRAAYDRNRSLVKLHNRIIPLRRAGRPEEISAVVTFLCDERASYVTGQDVVVDGGLSIVGQESMARAVAGARRRSLAPVATGRRRS
jgi:NAD(P)-dependent dehydrogenase (short-subunit alcohol dehydrogenase family)